jgi:hypothetical protein
MLVCVIVCLTPLAAFAQASPPKINRAEANILGTVPYKVDIESRLTFLSGLYRQMPNLFLEGAKYDFDMLQILKDQATLMSTLKAIPEYTTALQNRQPLSQVSLVPVGNQGNRTRVPVRGELPSEAVEEFQARLAAAAEIVDADLAEKKGTWSAIGIADLIKADLERLDPSKTNPGAIVAALQSLLSPSDRREAVALKDFTAKIEYLARHVDPEKVKDPTLFDPERLRLKTVFTTTPTLEELIRYSTEYTKVKEGLGDRLVLYAQLNAAPGSEVSKAAFLENVTRLNKEQLVYLSDEADVLRPTFDKVSADPAVRGSLIKNVASTLGQVFDKAPTTMIEISPVLLTEQPWWYGILRGFVSGDCSSQHSFAYPNDPGERTFFVSDPGSPGDYKGIVSASSVMKGGKRSLYVVTIHGSRISSADVYSILYGLDQIKGQLGYDVIELPTSENLKGLVNRGDLRLAMDSIAAKGALGAISYQNDLVRAAIEGLESDYNHADYDSRTKNSQSRSFVPDPQVVKGLKASNAWGALQTVDTSLPSKATAIQMFHDLLYAKRFAPYEDMVSFKSDLKVVGQKWGLDVDEVIGLMDAAKNPNQIPFKTFELELNQLLTKLLDAPSPLPRGNDTAQSLIDSRIDWFREGYSKAPDLLKPENSASTAKVLKSFVSDLKVALKDSKVPAYLFNNPGLLTAEPILSMIARDGIMQGTLIGRGQDLLAQTYRALLTGKAQEFASNGKKINQLILDYSDHRGNRLSSGLKKPSAPLSDGPVRAAVGDILNRYEISLLQRTQTIAGLENDIKRNGRSEAFWKGFREAVRTWNTAPLPEGVARHKILETAAFTFGPLFDPDYMSLLPVIHGASSEGPGTVADFLAQQKNIPSSTLDWYVEGFLKDPSKFSAVGLANVQVPPSVWNQVQTLLDVHGLPIAEPRRRFLAAQEKWPQSTLEWFLSKFNEATIGQELEWKLLSLLYDRKQVPQAEMIRIEELISRHTAEALPNFSWDSGRLPPKIKEAFLREAIERPSDASLKVVREYVTDIPKALFDKMVDYLTKAPSKELGWSAVEFLRDTVSLWPESVKLKLISAAAPAQGSAGWWPDGNLGKLFGQLSGDPFAITLNDTSTPTFSTLLTEALEHRPGEMVGKDSLYGEQGFFAHDRRRVNLNAATLKAILHGQWIGIPDAFAVLPAEGTGLPNSGITFELVPLKGMIRSEANGAEIISAADLILSFLEGRAIKAGWSVDPRNPASVGDMAVLSEYYAEFSLGPDTQGAKLLQELRTVVQQNLQAPTRPGEVVVRGGAAFTKAVTDVVTKYGGEVYTGEGGRTRVVASDGSVIEFPSVESQENTKSIGDRVAFIDIPDGTPADVAATSPASRASAEAMALARRHYSTLVNKTFPAILYLDLSSSFTPQESLFFEAITKTGQPPAGTNPTQLAKMVEAIDLKMAKAIEAQFIRPLDLYINDLRAGAARELPGVTGDALEQALKSRRLEFLKNGDVQGLFSESLNLAYRNMRLPAAPYSYDEDKYIRAESYVNTNKDLSTSPQGAWLYRGQDVGRNPVVQRGGLNVSISRELIKELDQLILTGKFRGYYKFGSLMLGEDSTALGWKRHDSITLYFTEDLSTEGRVALADVATRHGRGAHELLGEKIVDGFSLAVNVPDELLPKAVENVTKINPVIGSALKERLTRRDIGELAVSEGLYEAARATLRRFQVSFDYRRDSGLVVDKVSGLASQDVLKLASNDAPRMVDRLAIEAFEDISRTIATSEIEIPIAAESKELNVVWKELLRRIELPPAYIVSAEEIVEPSRIPTGSQKLTEYEAFKSDYDKILRKLMTLKGALYKADLTRLNLIKGFTAESSNRIVVTENFEALANPLGNEIRIGEQLFNLDYLVHEMAAMNLPRQLHLYNLVNGSKVNGEYPSHIQPFYTILDELISVTAEVSGRATPLQVTQTVSQRYAQTMDTLVALHKATPRLFSASPETIPADKLMIELQNIVLEQTTRPLRQALGDFDNARITAGQFQERVREFGMKVGWRDQVVYALGNLDPKTLAFLLRQVPIAGFNALAQSGDLDFRPPEAASRLQQALVQVGTREQLSSRVNAIVSVGFTKALNANDVVGIPTDPRDSFWKEWERGKFPKGYEFPIAGPRDRTKQNTIRSSVYITKGDAERRGSRDYLIGDRSWFDSLVVEGVSYEGKFMLLLKVDLGGNLPPQYKLSFIANGRNIKLAAEGIVPQVVLGLPRALAGRSTFTVQQLVPYSDVVNGQLNRAARAVFQGNFTPQDLEILEGCHIKPRVVTEALAKQNPVSYLSGDGHRSKADFLTLNRDIPQITAQMVAAVQPEVAAMQAARGVDNRIGHSSSRDASTSGLMEQFKWPQAARDLIGGLSDLQLQSVLSNNFSAFNAAAQRGDVEAMRAIGQLSLDPSSDKALLKQLVRGALLTRVPKGLGMSGDLDLVVRVRERVLKLPELTKTQRWVLEAGFKEMAREPLTDAERSNLVKLVEFFERGGKVSVPSQLFGGDTVYTPREVITRAAYINWAGEDRSSWREPTKLYQLLLEANILATEANQGLQGDALQRALDRTRSEMGLLGERFSDPKVAARVDRLNSKELYQFLYEYNRLPTRGDSAAGAVVGRFKSDEGASPKVPPSRLWDPVIATGARTSDPSTTAKAYLELRDANNRIVWKGLVGKEYNFENVDASRVTLRNYHSDPLLPDLVAEQAAGAMLPANEWLGRAAPGPVSATQARVAYTDARTADAIVASTAQAKGQQPGSRFVPDGLASRYGEVEVHSGVEPGRGRFTEVVMYREPQGGQSFRERFEALHAVELGFNSPATHFGEARSFDLAQAVPSASTMFSRRALRGAALGANLALDYVAIDAAILTYFQGGSGGDVARATAQATIDQFKSPEFYAITGTQYLLNAAAASEIPVVAGAGGVLAPVATTAMVSFGVTTLGMNAAWAYSNAPADRQNGAWDAVLAPFYVMNQLSDSAADSAFFPAMLHGNSVTREQMKNDPYMSEFLYSIDQLSPGENMANLFGYQGEHQQEPNLNDAINRILDENEASPFLFESEGGEEVKRFAELLLASPESEWKDRINFRRDVNAVAMGDTNRDLAQYLPYEERMGAGGGTNLPQGSWLGSTEVAKPTKSSEPLYINPPPETIDMSNWKMLSLGEAYTQPAEPVSSPAESLDAAVEVVADPQQLGSGVTFPIAEGQSAQQVAEHYEESSTAGPESPEWWKGSSLPDQSPFGPDGYQTDIFEDAAAGDYDYSSGDAPWEYGQYGDATYEFGIQLNGSCIDPATGEKVPC